MNFRYVGYDPGGNGDHGIAVFQICNGVPSIRTECMNNAGEALNYVLDVGPVDGVGVDTLTCWSGSTSGWRPADLWLREHYPEVGRSIKSPNSLHGAMSVNGMFFLVGIREATPHLYVTETHPKVLHWALWGQRYEWDTAAGQARMRERLEGLAGCVAQEPMLTEHEWDAAISAVCAYKGHSGEWGLDLHAEPVPVGDHLCFPYQGERARYSWLPN